MGAVSLVMMSGSVGVKRTIQAAYKNVTDEVGFQYCGQAGANDANCAMANPKGGYTDVAETVEGRIIETTRKEEDGKIKMVYDEGTPIPVSVTVSHYGGLQ